MKRAAAFLLNRLLYPILDHYLVTRGIPLLQARTIKNIRTQQLILGSRSTAEYVIRKMPTARVFEKSSDGLDYALGEVKWDGLFLEFGVFKGQSINFIAERVSQQVHGFDSFRGLPESWHTGYAKGAFAMPEGWRPKVRDNVRLHAGLFDDTLRAFVEEHPEDVCFIHIDSDLYSSAKTIFSYLGDRMKSGTIIVFDEYFNYPNWQENEYKAFQEFILEKGLDYEYLGYTVDYTQVVVRIL